MYLLAFFCHEVSCLSCHGCSVTICYRPRVSAWPALFAYYWKVQEGREERERGEEEGEGVREREGKAAIGRFGDAGLAAVEVWGSLSLGIIISSLISIIIISIIILEAR